jgi:hypothetical protein
VGVERSRRRALKSDQGEPKSEVHARITNGRRLCSLLSLGGAWGGSRNRPIHP